MKQLDTRSVRQRRDALFIAGTCGLRLTLGFVTLGSKSLWNDEAYSATVASGGWNSLFESLRERDANMTLYHVVLHLWRDLSSSDAFLRSLSVLCAAASVFVVFVLGRRLFGSTVGRISALVLAVAPFGVQYGQQVRSYSMLVLLVTLSSYLFVLSLESEGRSPWVRYILVSTLAVYAHFFAVLVSWKPEAS